MSELRFGLWVTFLIGAALFCVLGLWTITPLTQVVDAATSLSQDRIFKMIVLFILAAIAVKP